VIVSELSGSPPGLGSNPKAVPITPRSLSFQVPAAISTGGGPVLVSQPSDPQLTAMVIVEPDCVLSLTSPFESTCCVPVQLPCETQLSETTFVMVTSAAGVETCTEFCVWFAVSAPLPAWLPVPFLVGPCCSATIPGETMLDRR
jgi:hypothetical protein